MQIVMLRVSHVVISLKSIMSNYWSTRRIDYHRHASIDARDWSEGKLGFLESESEIYTWLEHDGLLLEVAMDWVKKSRSYVEKAIRHNPLALQFASNDLRSDEDLVMMAIERNPEAIQFASQELLSNTELVWSTAVKQLPTIVCRKYKIGNYIIPRVYIIQALHLQSSVYEELSDVWYDDWDLCYQAVGLDYMNFFHSKEEFRDKVDLVIAVLKHEKLWQTPTLFHDLKITNHRDNLQFFKIVGPIIPEIMSMASRRILLNDKLWLCILKESGASCLDIRSTYVPWEYCWKYQGWLNICRVDGLSIEYALDEWKDDYLLASVAVQNNPRAILFVGDTLKSDRRLVISAISRDGMLLSFMNETLRNDRHIVMLAVTNDGNALTYASQDLKNDLDIVTVATSNNPLALENGSEILRGDIGLVSIALNSVISQDINNVPRCLTSPHGPNFDWINIPLLSHNVSQLRYESEETFINVLTGLILTCDRSIWFKEKPKFDLNAIFGFMRHNASICANLFD
jgi:hypothetical protein